MIYLKTCVGIELNGEDILISSVQSNFSGGVFTGFARIPDYANRTREELKREVNSFFKTNGLSKDNIILGIPRKDVVLRYLDLPAEVTDNLKQVVQYQVQSFEPTEEDRFYHDYAVIPNGNGGKRLAVMLAMVRKSLLDEILKFLAGLDIKPVGVLFGSIGLSNIVLNNSREAHDKTYILADLSPASLEIVALHHGSIAYSREVPKEEGQSWKDLMLREIDDAASKIRLGPEGTLEKIILSGEAADSAHEELRAELPDCELIEDTLPLNVPGENRMHIQEAASALGLALTGMVRRPAIQLNLLPPDRRIRQSRWAYVPSVICGLVILALLAGMGFHKTIQNRSLLQQLDREIAALTKPVQKVKSYQSEADELEKKIKTMDAALNSRDMNLEILRELTTKLPDDTYLNMYRYQEGTIQISGLSTSVSDLIRELEKSPLLKDVTQKVGTTRDNLARKDRFTIEAKLER